MLMMFYVFALVSLAIGTAAVYMTLIQAFPVQWLYYHYFVRKPLTWAILLGGVGVALFVTWQIGEFPLGTIAPLLLMGLAVILAHRMHQENAFKAVDFPAMAGDISALPLDDDTQMGVVEFNGVTKAYPLDYVQHHHIINDRFGDGIVSLTYCAMCHSIIPFDVSDIDPLFVGSFKNANMVVADRKTKTFFQQATFTSIIGRLHPRTLRMLPFQVLSWGDVKKLDPRPEVVEVTKEDLKDFQLPIPGIWKKVLASEFTPGLSAKKRDTTFPARTRVVGIIDAIAQPQVVYLKAELMEQGVVI